MHDRVVDRAAAYTTPGHLAIRDWLLIALSFASGFYEAVCFLSFGKVFAGFQTGNIAFLGFGIAGTRPPAGPNPVTVIISLAAFAVGAVVAMPILHAYGAETDVDEERFVWPRRVSATLGVGLVLEIAFLIIWLTTSKSTGSTDVLIALGAMALGMQMNAVRSMHVPGTSTTAFTATFIGLVSGAATWSLSGPAVRRLLGGCVALGLGAWLGDFMLSNAHAYAPVVPVAIIAVVITVASEVLNPKRQPASPALATDKLATHTD
jgi:uncharacterized membrane protein YoaK (UPF0700 family)